MSFSTRVCVASEDAYFLCDSNKQRAENDISCQVKTNVDSKCEQLRMTVVEFFNLSEAATNT